MIIAEDTIFLFVSVFLSSLIVYTVLVLWRIFIGRDW